MRQLPALWLALIFIPAISFLSCGKSAHPREQKRETKPIVPAVAAGVSQVVVPLEYSLTGRVQKLVPVIHTQADSNSPVVGWLRFGSMVKLKSASVKTSECKSGWHEIFPLGVVCVGSSIEILNKSEPLTTRVPQYQYYFVKDVIAAEYDWLPSSKQHQTVLALVQRYRDIRKESEALADAFGRGDRTGKLQKELLPPNCVRRFLQRGFYLAVVSTEGDGHGRTYGKTARGTYVWMESLEPRTLPAFEGVALGKGRSLPLAWTTRGVTPLIKKVLPDGTLRFVDDKEAAPMARQTIVNWVEREYNGNLWMHKLAGDRYLHPWFVAVAEKINPPLGTQADEVWVHVDRTEQTLVLYRGKEPIFATLVSTGVKEHETPVGEFVIRAKHVTATMSDIGSEVRDDRYSIEDVPWTQYFRGSLALHGTFWHDKFGLPRSHGCVNISPKDAERLFMATLPRVPSGWHGISARDTKLQASRVVITD